MYPVHYEADYLRERNRLTTFFRLIVAIPWLVVAIFYGIASLIVVIIAWFSLIILGRYPRGMYDFVGGVLRFSMRVNAFVSLQTDAWPPFGISDEPDYPVRVAIAPPAARQSRLKAFFRIILAIPLLLMSYLFSYLQQFIALISWVTIVFRGYQPAAIHNALAFTNGWITRAYSYMLLMRDEYPPVGDEVQVEIDPPAVGHGAPTEAVGPPGETPAIDPAGGPVEAQPEVPQPPEQPPRD